MYPGEPWWEQLVGGIAVHRDHLRPMIVLESLALVPSVIGSTLIRPDTLLLVRDNSAPPAPFRFPGQPFTLLTYTGSFDASQTLSLPEWNFDVRPYGLAQLSTSNGPTLLRIFDDADFSAFLRDADRAFTEGVFADHMTNPQVVLADSVGLGDDPSGAGPTNRLFVFSDGSLSISPAGRTLGDIDDPLALLDTRWREVNQNSERPCAVCLGLTIDERDRAEALLERIWISRYLVVARAIRLARRHGRETSAVSGFGGRMTASAQTGNDPTQVDAGDAPIVLRGRSGYWVQDSTRWRTESLSLQDVRCLEGLLASLAGRSGSAVSGTPRSFDAATESILDRLSSNGISGRWCERSLAGSGQEIPVRQSWL